MKSELNERRKKPNESCWLIWKLLLYINIFFTVPCSAFYCYKVIQRWLGLPGDSDIYCATKRLQYEAYRLTSDISTKECELYRRPPPSLTP